jgi:O-antigen ligase
MSRFNNPAALLKPERSRHAAVRPAATEPAMRPSAGVSTLPLSTQPASPAGISRLKAQVAEGSGVLGRIGFAAALAYVFIRFALLSDAITAILGFKPFLTYMTAPIALLGVLFTGGLMRAVRFKPGIFFCAFLGWLLLAVPFSVWRGGSTQTLFTAFEADFSMFFMIVGLTTTWYRFRMMLFAIAAGGVCDFLLCLLYPGSLEGRFVLSFGVLSNPNDLATHVLFVLPMCVFVFLVSRRFSVAKFVITPTIIGFLVIVLRTGSRAALLSLIGLAIYLFFRGSMAFKIMALVAVAVVGPITLLSLPADVRYRYISMFSSGGPEVGTDEEAYRASIASSSSEARKALLMNSVSETFHNPLFGVGPGQFATAEADVAKELGQRAAWQVTHNTYTEVSAEAGIPAFLFFVGALFGAMKLLYQVQKRSRLKARLDYLAVPAFWLMVCGIGLSINIFFAALAYQFYIPTFIALAMVAASLADDELRNYPAQKPS